MPCLYTEFYDILKDACASFVCYLITKSLLLCMQPTKTRYFVQYIERERERWLSLFLILFVSILYRILAKLCKQGSWRMPWVKAFTVFTFILLLHYMKFCMLTSRGITHSLAHSLTHTHTGCTIRIANTTRQVKKKKVTSRQCTSSLFCLCECVCVYKTHETKKNDWKQ